MSILRMTIQYFYQMKFNTLLEHKLYITALVLLIGLLCFTDIDTLGINKTVGMAWNLVDLGTLICLISLLFSFIAYSILALLKYPTHRILSLIWLGDILPVVIISKLSRINEVAILFGIVSIVVLVINVIFSIRTKKK